ncbi:hypothetical protein HYS03_00485 [Candidatus Woesebacteria bacterium]|nr:hypothetical protein [Candidatus Woesebacteria bacterium]QQG47633.1 MAG: hypothetical protein HY044_00925 [Candidatus Woesebacteria bacterium]
MKKIILLSLLFSFFLLFARQAQAQQPANTFQCSCVSDGLGGKTCVIVRENCNSGSVSNLNLCSTDPGCKDFLNGATCTIQCVASSNIQNITWGGACDPNNSNQKCADNTSCRTDFSNNFRCLLPVNSVNTNKQCQDTNECIGYTDPLIVSRCGTPQGSTQSICQPLPKGQLCKDTPNASCKASCNTQTEDRISANVTDCSGATPVCCAPKSSTTDTVVCKTNGKDGIDTAVGCVPITEINSFAAKVFGFAAGIAGGIAIFLIIVGGFQIITSQGDPYKLKEGREVLNSAILGLLFIIFAVFLLRVIGVDILGVIPK